MNMIISGVTTDKTGKNKAYIIFEEDKRNIEIVIPECTVLKNNGFNEDELSQLIDYVKANLTELKKEAAKINPVKAMMDDN